jgi:allophanate hydrolase subunit 1
MKKLVRRPLGVAVATVLIAAAALPLPIYAQSPDNGHVDFGKFTPPDKGGEFVEVNVNSNLIAMVSRLTKHDDPDVAEVLAGLKQVHVNVISLDSKNRDDVIARIKQIRTDLESKSWEKVVTAVSGSDDVAVFVKTRDDKSLDGVAVTVISGDNQAVLVNVVGDIKPEKLALVGEKFDIEPLKKLKLKNKNS